MNEEELIFLVSVTVIMPILVLWIIFSYQKARLKYRRSQTENSLTTSELDALIEDSVTRATSPLVDRIEALEERVQLSADGRKLELDFDRDKEEEPAPPAKTLGRSKA